MKSEKNAKKYREQRYSLITVVEYRVWCTVYSYIIHIHQTNIHYYRIQGPYQVPTMY